MASKSLPSGSAVTRRSISRVAMLLAATLGGCAADVGGNRPGAGSARQAELPGSPYAGWRLFNDRCAGCHGVDAAGPAKMPGLLEHVREMGRQRFVHLVLERYDWSLPAAESGGEDAARIALVEEIMRRDEAPIQMPAWKDEPAVSAHILDLYAYLAARADGALPPGRPGR